MSALPEATIKSVSRESVLRVLRSASVSEDDQFALASEVEGYAGVLACWHLRDCIEANDDRSLAALSVFAADPAVKALQSPMGAAGFEPATSRV